MFTLLVILVVVVVELKLNDAKGTVPKIQTKPLKKEIRQQTPQWQNFIDHYSVPAIITSTQTHVYFTRDAPCNQDEDDLDVCAYNVSKSQLENVFDKGSECYLKSSVVEVYYKKEFTTSDCCGPALCADGLSTLHIFLIIFLPVLAILIISAICIIRWHIKRKKRQVRSNSVLQHKNDEIESDYHGSVRGSTTNVHTENNPEHEHEQQYY